MKLNKLLSIMLVIIALISCATLPNESNVKTPDGEVTSCVMPNGTVTDLYMFKSLKGGHYYSWYVINDVMDLFQNPVNNFSSSDRKDFTSLKPVNKQGVFQAKYSAADLGELADYMQTNGFSCGFWHEIRGGKMIIAEVWTENNSDYMYRELACQSKITVESLTKEIEAIYANYQQSEQDETKRRIAWIRAVDAYNTTYFFAGGSVGLSDSEGHTISHGYVKYELPPQIHIFKTAE